MKVFDFIAHEGYQYEFCKLNCQVTMVVDSESGRSWDKRSRPVPQNVRFIDKSELSMHVVEQHNVAIIHNWKQFQLLRECNIPKIIVMHCSRAGQGDAEFASIDLDKYHVVFNSYKDQERWALKNKRQRVIWHGFDPAEWPVSARSINRIFTVGRRISERDAVCGYRIVQEFQRSGMPVKILGEDVTLGIDAPESFEEFKKCHAMYSCYLNPTLRSPMPRGRGEAMMSGIPIITTDFYDESLFIVNGVNGFRSNNLQQLKEFASLLLVDTKMQEQIAKNIRKTAEDKFHISRFLTEWQEVISDVTQADTSNLVQVIGRATKVYVTRKDSSSGGGTVTSDNVISGLKRKGYKVSCLDINSKGWVSYVDGSKTPATSSRQWENFIKENPADIIIFDDIDRYSVCKQALDPTCKIYLCILGNPQVHATCWYEDGILNLNSPNNRIRKILCRPVYGRYLKNLFGEERIISWVGGCDGVKMRSLYGQAKYKHPRDGALIISAHRGTDWWKNPNTAVLAAYGIYRKYPQMIYFKPSPNDFEDQLLKNIENFDIQYGGSAKSGMGREELLNIMPCAQLAIEPFFSEGYSRSCNEMMNMGLPVIQGANASWYLGENDLLAKHLLLRDPSDIQEIVDKALILLENEDLWNEVSNECVKFFSKFNLEQEVDTLIGALES